MNACVKHGYPVRKRCPGCHPPTKQTPIDQARVGAQALFKFLFPENGEWEFYTSPKGYGFLKIKQKKEQAA